MNTNKAQLVLALIASLVAVQCQAMEVFDNLVHTDKNNKADVDNKADVEEELMKHKDLEPEKVANLLASIAPAKRTDEFEQFLALASYELDSCMSNELEDRESLCQEAEFTSLRNYCHYCVEKVREFCKKTDSSKIVNYYLDNNPEIQSIVDQVPALVSQVKDYGKSKSVNYKEDPNVVKSFCRDMEHDDREDKVDLCYNFTAVVDRMLAHNDKKPKEILSYLDQRTGKYPGDFDEGYGLCEVMLDKCS